MTEMSSTAGSGRAGTRRRVSHRRELAVVTFAAVASIAGVGGFLAAHQPVTHTSQPAVQQAPAIQTAWRTDDGGGDDGGQVLVRQAQGTSPSFSSGSHAAPSAVSQGSVPAVK
jgi:hypothetical protein